MMISMEWKRIENVIRRTKLPMIVTEGVEEPLIIMPLTAYEDLLAPVEEVSARVDLSQEMSEGLETFAEDTSEQKSDTLAKTAEPDMPFSGFLREDDGKNFAKISDFSASERLMF